MSFDDAAFYSCREPDELSLESPEEALAQFFEDHWAPGKTWRDSIREHAPVTVTGYELDTVHSSWAQYRAERAIEEMTEDFLDEYGDPNGNHNAWTKAQLDEIYGDLLNVFTEAASSATVWRCSPCGEREYSGQELLEMFADKIANEGR